MLKKVGRGRKIEESIDGDASAIEKIAEGKFTPGQISNTIAKLQLNHGRRRFYCKYS
ncbi:MAG: hypothetical protein ACLT2Z_09525 [Eubacterium sp.]